jgi:hypothetical protein
MEMGAWMVNVATSWGTASIVTVTIVSEEPPEDKRCGSVID